MRMTIGKKMIGGFLAVLTLMLAMGIGTSLINRKVERLANESIAYLKLDMFLDETIGDHLSWMNDLANQFISDKLFEGQLDPHKCGFGEWYDTFESSNPEIMRMHAAIDGPHQRLHDLARKSRELYLKGDKEAAKEVYVNEINSTMSEIQEKMSKLSDVLMAKIAQLGIEREQVVTFARWAIPLLIFLAIVVGFAVALVISRGITKPIASLVSVSEAVAEGDLTSVIEVKAKDEIGQLARSFSKLMQGLRGIVKQIYDANSQVLSVSNEILSSSQQQAANAKEQSAAISETTSAANELTKTAEGVNKSIGRISQAANNALVGMGKIKDTMRKTGEVVTSLSEKSRKINQITELIDDVADQTNLLAVNASIEAARAGEEGRGFTVVADEIRKLADSTAKSTKDITGLIEVIQNEMSNAIMSVEESIAGIEEEAKAAKETVDQSREIAMSSNQQVGGAKQIAEAMNNASGAMKEIASGTGESQIAAKQLAYLAEDLKKATEKFTITEEKGKNAV